MSTLKTEKPLAIAAFCEALGEDWRPLGDGSYAFEESVLVDFHAMPSGVGGFDDSSQSLVKLHRIYVVDAVQGEGVGTRCLVSIKEAAEQAGVGVFLIARRYWFVQQMDFWQGLHSQYETRWRVFPSNLQELLRYWGGAAEGSDQGWEESSLVEWYARCGFRLWFIGDDLTLHHHPPSRYHTRAMVYWPKSGGETPAAIAKTCRRCR